MTHKPFVKKRNIAARKKETFTVFDISIERPPSVFTTGISGSFCVKMAFGTVRSKWHTHVCDVKLIEITMFS